VRLRIAASLLGATVLLSTAPLRAQEDTTRDEFWPEVDAYWTLTDRSRLFLLATIARNREVDFAEGMVGGHVDFFLKPLARPWLRDTPDAVKRRFFAFRLGYRYGWDLHDPEEYEEHRILLETTGRAPPVERFVLINRISPRRPRPERRVVVAIPQPHAAGAGHPPGLARRHPLCHGRVLLRRPLRRVEPPALLQRNRVAGGRQVYSDTYYCRQNDSRSSIAHVDAFGLALNLFF